MKSKNILIFYTPNKKSVQFNTLFKVYLQAGHKVFLLTTSPIGPLHHDALTLGISIAEGLHYDINSAKGKLMIMLSLVSFCKKHNIETVISHLQPANLIAVFAQFFTKATFFIFRHHFNFSFFTSSPFGTNSNETRADKIINSLAKKIIVPSTGVYKGMVEIENVPPGKIEIVPYIYNFTEYPKPDPQAVQVLQAQFKADLRLLMCSRMVPLKRHMLVLKVVNRLLKEGHQIKLLLVDEGPEKERLIGFVKNEGVEDRIHFLGFRNDLINIMAASDLLVHPSLTEASNSTVKEMGLVNRTAIVCKGVGDFDEYLTDENAFLVELANPEDEIYNILKTVCKDKQLLNIKGESLNRTVLSTFSASQEVIERYLQYT